MKHEFILSSYKKSLMTSSERKEVIKVNGLTILIVMALLANFLIVGFVYKYHNYQLFVSEKTSNYNYGKLLEKERDLKNEIIALEGVSSWGETQYMKSIR